MAPKAKHQKEKRKGEKKADKTAEHPENEEMPCMEDLFSPGDGEPASGDEAASNPSQDADDVASAVDDDDEDFSGETKINILMCCLCLVTFQVFRHISAM